LTGGTKKKKKKKKKKNLPAAATGTILAVLSALRSLLRSPPSTAWLLRNEAVGVQLTLTCIHFKQQIGMMKFN
jgi:hypothetical protein